MNRPTPPADKGVGTDSKQYPGNSGTKLKLHFPVSSETRESQAKFVEKQGVCSFS